MLQLERAEASAATAAEAPLRYLLRRNSMSTLWYELLYSTAHYKGIHNWKRLHVYPVWVSEIARKYITELYSRQRMWMFRPRSHKLVTPLPYYELAFDPIFKIITLLGYSIQTVFSDQFSQNVSLPSLQASRSYRWLSRPPIERPHGRPHGRPWVGGYFQCRI